MKFVCVLESKNYPELKIGKVYESDNNINHAELSDTFVINTSNAFYVYPRRFFKTIDEYRNMKINKILK